MKKTNLVEDLRQKGYRITEQRQTILEVFVELDEGKHLSAEELLEHLKKQNQKISLATLYRNLKMLTNGGVLRELDFGEDHKHYELNISNKPHHHIICSNCYSTIEFDEKELENIATKVADNNNFKVNDFQFKIFGICNKCK